MCGITGIFDPEGRSVDVSLLRDMTAAIAHRGPDGEGFHVGRGIALGHRRLSIIDLEGGAQPIANEDSTIHVVFNGEIYNFVELRSELLGLGHVFRTRSDTEVIVHAYEQWGPGCTTRFNGIFAFALWDEARQRLLLARDHVGVKPLYYRIAGGIVFFASEIKALLKDPKCERSVDLAALADLFTFRFVPSPRTMFQGISKLPPGHWLLADRSGVRTERFWTVLPVQQRHKSEAELIECYQSLVEDAVRLQLRSDVPVGLFLSSGVDSGALLALMRGELSGPIHTFTIGFEGGEESNETDDAREIARRFDAQHSEMIIGPSDYRKYYDRYLWDLEEPVGNETAAAFYFVSLLAGRDVKVALTGQGADEPWAGYHRYLGVHLSESYRKLPSAIRHGLIRPFVNALPRNERLKRGVASLDEADVLTRFAKVYSFFTPEMRDMLFGANVKARIPFGDYESRAAIAHLQADVRDLDAVSQMLYIDTRASLPDDLLMVGDKTSMANSIEARVPFLDHRLVEFVESLPIRYKLRHGKGKYLHKKAMEKWLPSNVVYRKKKGFANPVDQWLRSQLRSYVDDCLFDPSSCIAEYFDLSYVRELVRLHESGRENYMRHIYLLISLEMWHRRFIRGS